MNKFCGCGGIGRRRGFKIPRWQHLVGSSPTIRTILIHLPVKDKSIKFNFLNKDQFVKKFFEISSKRSTNNALYGLSFAESIFFPIPIDPLLAACVIAKPKKIFLITFLTTFASVFGGIIGWCIGLYIGVGLQNLVEFIPGLSVHKLESVNEAFREWGLILTFIGAFTPLPYKVFTIASGLIGFNILIFIIISLISRGLRFFIVSYLWDTFWL